MGVRPEDVYAYVATDDIYAGGICAFRKGDPVPESTVEEQGWVDSGQAVLRTEWDDRPADEPDRPMKRGEMPPHLQSKEAPKGEDAAGSSSSKKTTAKKTDS